MIPILKSEWSFAQLKVQDARCKVIFTKENTFMAVSHDGNVFKAQFDPEKGGEC
jgi:imidazoleglycerol phosphate synthase glutamine amidotransferase subunit HisH